MTAAVTPERLVSGLPPFYIRYSPRAISPYTERVSLKAVRLYAADNRISNNNLLLLVRCACGYVICGERLPVRCRARD